MITLLDHDLATQTGATDRFGNDYVAGGAGDDMIFGQLGDDVVQGDGSVDYRSGNKVVGAFADANGVLVVIATFEAVTDGDDYIEGGGGSDTIFGGLGQDDIIGGSSNLFSLTSMAQRPDRSDVIFGGAGTDIARNDRTAGHAADSDTIVGDNGNVYRLVGVNGVLGTGFLTFTYDTYGEPVRLLPRAVTLLDYTAGGPALRPGLFTGLTPTMAATWGQMVNDIWGADEVHGESGDDTVYVGGGNDIVYGDAGDDDIVGGWGNDWISGGAGVDGVIGDDGRILTSRNGSTEPLNGLLTANAQSQVRTPGGLQEAVLFPRGWLTKSVRLTPFSLDPAGEHVTTGTPVYANDVIFGGLDSDFLHGGAGDDAISGAEALVLAYAPTYGGSVIRTDWSRPFNDGTLLGYDARTGRFALYDPRDPRRRVMLNADGSLDKSGSSTRQFFLNFDATEGGAAGSRFDDGGDVIFGDNGNDWLVGGTGRDTLWGGWGNDLLNVDDDLGTHGGLNDQADTDASYQDRAVGGAGRDVLMGNTAGDRLIDWSNEVNTYLVPFWPTGEPTIVRLGSRALDDFLYALSRAQGADQGLGTAGPRHGEPFGEVGLVSMDDRQWFDEWYGSADTWTTYPHAARDTDQRTSDLETLATTRQASWSNPTAAVPPTLPTVEVDDTTVIGGPHRGQHGQGHRPTHPGSAARLHDHGPLDPGRRVGQRRGTRLRARQRHPGLRRRRGQPTRSPCRSRATG